MNGERVTGVVEWLNGWLATKTWPSLICRTLPLSVLHAKYRNSHCRQSSTSTSITHWLRQEISLTCPKTRGQKAQLFCPVNYKPYSRKTGALIKNLFSPVGEGREVRGLRRVEEKRQEERWSLLAFSLPAPSLSDHTQRSHLPARSPRQRLFVSQISQVKSVWALCCPVDDWILLRPSGPSHLGGGGAPN